MYTHWNTCRKISITTMIDAGIIGRPRPIHHLWLIPKVGQMKICDFILQTLSSKSCCLFFISCTHSGGSLSLNNLKATQSLSSLRSTFHPACIPSAANLSHTIALYRQSRGGGGSAANKFKNHWNPLNTTFLLAKDTPVQPFTTWLGVATKSAETRAAVLKALWWWASIGPTVTDTGH